METDFGNKEIFAKNLQKYMDINNIDRNALAEKLDVSYTTLNEWFKGSAYPRIDKIELLANFFGIRKSDLIEDNYADGLNDKLSQFVKDVVRIPVLGKIPAGMPMEAVEDTYTIDYEEIPASWIKGGQKYFALRLDGDSMEPEYHDGDVVAFLQTKEALSGQDCCVLINGTDATFKRVFIQKDGLLVSPINVANSSGFLPTKFTPDQVQNEPIEIIGVAKRHIRNIK